METIPDNGYKFVLCVIDVFSKYAFCTPLKDKSGKTVLNAVKDIVSKNVRQPEKIWVDRGSEFYNKDFLAWASEHNIIVYSTYGDSKSVVAERFIRTLRDLMTRKFTAQQSYAWVKMLPHLVKFYNNKFHKTIRMTPTQASDPKNSIQVFLRLQSNHGTERKKKKPKFSVGDQVRISRLKGTFEKGSDTNWSHEVLLSIKFSIQDPQLTISSI